MSGSPGAPLPDGTLPSPPEPVLGEIPRAFQMTRGFGPVRIIFTASRILVYNDGDFRAFPSPDLYRSWRSALPSGDSWRITGAPLYPSLTPPLWNVENSGVVRVQVRQARGIGIEKDDIEIGIFLRPDQVVSGPGGSYPFRVSTALARIDLRFRAVGDARELFVFLQHMPIGPRVTDRYAVSTGWSWGPS
ncbi:MAG TPA: hypothetical protein VMG14_05050 [Thermoplasmata archaeon]|nr:hypothetical protein [Thermoplasmata archaeon]